MQLFTIAIEQVLAIMQALDEHKELAYAAIRANLAVILENAKEDELDNNHYAVLCSLYSNYFCESSFQRPEWVRTIQVLENLQEIADVHRDLGIDEPAKV